MLTAHATGVDTMPFAQKQLLEFAHFYEAQEHDQSYGALYSACAAGLRAWEARRGLYRDTTRTARRFLAELEKLVTRYCVDLPPTKETSQETAFALIECLACVIREAALGSKTETPDEEAVLTYFEACGEWLPNDAGLASECYYKGIPATAGSAGSSTAP